MTLRRNILASWLSHALTLVVGLYLVRYVKGTLGDTGYGAWIFVSAIAGYSGLLYMGFGAAVCRWSAKYHALQDWSGLNRVLSSIAAVYAFNSLIAIAAAGLCAGLAPSLSDWEGQSLTEVRQVLLLLGVNAAASLWGSVYAGLLFGIQRLDLQRAVVVSCTLVRAALTIVGLHYAPTLLVMAGTFLAVTVIENTAYYVLAHRLVPQLNLSWRHVSKSAFRECYGFTAFNALSMISDYLISLTDTIVIGCMVGTAATVPYFIAQRLCQMARAPLEQLAEVMLPKAGELQARGEQERLRQLILRTTGLSLLLSGGFAIGSWYFAERLLLTWLGPGNEASWPILMVLLAVQVIGLPLHVSKMALLGLGEIRVPALLDAAQAVANLVLSVVLVQAWGVIGVAWGTLIPAVVFNLGLLLPYACRRLGITGGRLSQETLLPQVLPLAALWLYCVATAPIDWPMNWLSVIAIAACGGSLLIGVRAVEHFGLRRVFALARLPGTAPSPRKRRDRVSQTPLAHSREEQVTT